MSANRLSPSDSCWLPGQAGRGAAALPPFSVWVDQPTPGVVVVGVFGEIDLLTAPVLRGHLSRQLAAEPARLVIDLTHTSFLGASALSVLLNIRRATAQRGTRLHLRAPIRPVPARALHLAGLDRLCEVVAPTADTDHPPAHRPDCPAHPPRPRPAPGTDTAVPVQTTVETAPDEYAHLIPLQRRYAQLPAQDPHRRRLRDHLICGYRPVAEHLARRFARRGEPLEDLIQVATVGLINAIDRFDPDRGSHFLSFAIPTITGEIRRHFRDHSWSTRVPRRLKDLNLAIRGAQAQLAQHLGRAARPREIANQLGVSTAAVLEALQAAEAYRSSSLDDLLNYEHSTATIQTVLGTSDPQMSLIDDRETLRPLLSQLTPQQRTIITLRFFHQFTQDQIAKQIGVSQMHVSRLLRQTLNFLHQHITDPP